MDVRRPSDARTDLTSGADLVGYNVEAVDGGIGKIDEATYEAGSSVVVDTGPWIFGKKVMLPASVVTRVDVDEETVFVSRTKDEIKKRRSSTRIATASRAIATSSAATTRVDQTLAGTTHSNSTRPPGSKGRPSRC